MSRLESLMRFMWEFVVGDDWRIAAGVVLTLAVTAVLAGAGVAVWWLMPVAVVALLTASIWRALRPSRPLRPSRAGN